MAHPDASTTVTLTAGELAMLRASLGHTIDAARDTLVVLEDHKASLHMAGEPTGPTDTELDVWHQRLAAHRRLADKLT